MFGTSAQRPLGTLVGHGGGVEFNQSLHRIHQFTDNGGTGNTAALRAWFTSRRMSIVRNERRREGVRDYNPAHQASEEE